MQRRRACSRPDAQSRPATREASRVEARSRGIRRCRREPRDDTAAVSILTTRADRPAAAAAPSVIVARPSATSAGALAWSSSSSPTRTGATSRSTRGRACRSWRTFVSCRAASKRFAAGLCSCATCHVFIDAEWMRASAAAPLRRARSCSPRSRAFDAAAFALELPDQSDRRARRAAPHRRARRILTMPLRRHRIVRRSVLVRRAHHRGAAASHAVGAFAPNSLFYKGSAPWHGCCNGSPSQHPFAQSGEHAP